MSKTLFLIESRKAIAALEAEEQKFTGTFQRIDSLREQAESERQAWEASGDLERLHKSARAAAEAETLSSAVGDISELKERIRYRFFAERGIWDSLHEDAKKIQGAFDAIVRAEESRVAKAIGGFIESGGDPVFELCCPPQLQDRFSGIAKLLPELRTLRDRRTYLRGVLAVIASSAEEPSRRSESAFFEAREHLESAASGLPGDSK